jgi:hypothetical protein
VGLTHGTDDNWDGFSVQWDGYLSVYELMVFATASNDGSRMWMDFNGDGVFSTSGPEFINNHWGKGQTVTFSGNSDVIVPGSYRIRMQYEEGTGDDFFMFYGARPALSLGEH